MKKNRIIKWILLITWMAIIFIMSHQKGEVSSAQSEVVLKIFAFFGIYLNDYFGELATFIVRKGAHFTEYMILYFLFYNVIRMYMTTKNSKMYSIILVFLYACSDEFHQYFIEGRGPSFRDVLIDTSGGITGCLISYLIEKQKIKKGVSQIDK